MAESTSSKLSVSISGKQPSNSKRLLFDRRYGWVIDEWRDPSDEALDGGRGMFCILPLTKALVRAVSQSINLAAVSVIETLKRPQDITPHKLHAVLDDGFCNFLSSFQQNQLFCGKNAPHSSLPHDQMQVSDSQKFN